MSISDFWLGHQIAIKRKERRKGSKPQQGGPEN
jgi:hypothetical protein